MSKEVEKMDKIRNKLKKEKQQNDGICVSKLRDWINKPGYKKTERVKFSITGDQKNEDEYIIPISIEDGVVICEYADYFEDVNYSMPIDEFLENYDGLKDFVCYSRIFKFQDCFSIEGGVLTLNLREYGDLEFLKQLVKDQEYIIKDLEEDLSFKNSWLLESIEDSRIYYKTLKQETTRIKNKLKELEEKEKQELKGLKGQDRHFVKQLYDTKINLLNELLE